MVQKPTFHQNWSQAREFVVRAGDRLGLDPVLVATAAKRFDVFETVTTGFWNTAFCTKNYGTFLAVITGHGLPPMAFGWFQPARVWDSAGAK